MEWVRKGARSSLRRKSTRRVAFVFQGRILLSPFHPFVSPILWLSTTRRATDRMREVEAKYASRTRKRKKNRRLLCLKNRKKIGNTIARSLSGVSPSSSIFRRKNGQNAISRVVTRCFIRTTLTASTSLMKIARKSISQPR